MADATLLPLLQMGLMAGMLHSLDADHVAAVSVMSDQKTKSRWPWFSLHWAMGHGAAVIVVAMAVLVLGMAVPWQMSAVAERAVAFTLILLGVMAWYQLYREYRGKETKPFGASKAAAVGLLHGSAGSAPLLALLPATAFSSPAWGLFYIVLFCLGVLLAMLLLGRALATSLSTMHRSMHYVAILLRPLFAAFSLGLGIYLAFF